LPTLERLMTQGVTAPLNSTIPHTSAPAWCAFMTGKNPGKTGIYDFLFRQPDSYNFTPHNGLMRAGKTLWGLLSDHGRRVGVLNVPMTYPVESVNGALVSGWMTPYQARDFVYPPELLNELETALGAYTIYPAATFRPGQEEAYFEACHRLLEARTASARFLMSRDPWDFFMTVFFDTDRILHQLWHYVDPQHPWRNGDRDQDKSSPIRHYFQHLDACIGQLLESAGEDTLVMVMSDHGMGTARNMVVLNTWLLEEGWLYLRNTPISQLKRQFFQAGFTLRNVHQWVDRLGLAKHAEYKVMYSADRLLKKLFLSFDDVDWSRSRAYSFGRSVGPLYLNVKGREPQGIIQPGREYQQTRDELAAQAREMRNPLTGEKLVREVLYREDVYSGPYVEQAPDLILLPADEADNFYGLADFGDNRVVAPMYRYAGMHRQHGLVILHGSPIRPGAVLPEADIVDLAPTILHAMELPIPSDMDGHALRAAFTPPIGERPSAWQTPDRPAPQPDGTSYSPTEARSVEDRLRQLGYFG